MIDEGGAKANNMHEAFQQTLVDVQDEVRAAFGWSVSSDRLSAEAMIDCVRKHSGGAPHWSIEARNETLGHLKAQLLDAREVVVLGAAATAAEVKGIEEEDVMIIAADGSVGALPGLSNLACVVSDFDGGEHLDAAAKRGAVMLVHAHGDNMSRWQSSLDAWSRLVVPPRLVLSHQTPEPVEGAYNFGGFTDGDRAVCFALAIGVKRENIRLLGFSLREVGPWSATTVHELKLQKLEWMNRILTSVGLDGAVAK